MPSYGGVGPMSTPVWINGHCIFTHFLFFVCLLTADIAFLSRDFSSLSYVRLSVDYLSQSRESTPGLAFVLRAEE